MMEIIRMIVVLSVITGAAGFALSGLKVWTAPIIENQVLTYVQGPSIKTIFPDTSNNPIAERKEFVIPGGEEHMKVFPAMKDGKLAGVAFESFGDGYGGKIGVMVGFDVQKDTLAGISVTTHKETPGLGSRTTEPAYTNQFKQHGIDKIALSSQGGDIDAVSGASISSGGTVVAVNKAVELYKQLKNEFTSTW